MDPFTQAARRFRARRAVFWKVSKTPVLRAAAPAAQRKELTAALRWEEAQPDCRRPLCVVEEPFEEAATYFSRVSQQVLESYRALCAAAEEAGCPLPQVEEAASPLAVVAAVKTAHDVARALPASLDGLSVLLSPVAVRDAAAWAAQVAALSKTVSLLSGHAGGPSSAVRWMVHDTPAGPLAPVLGEGVELALDEGAVFDFWRAAILRAAPKTPAPLERGAQPQTRGLSAETSAALRAHLVAAAEHLRAGDAKRAALAYHAARAICGAAGLAVEEAGILMAAAGAELAVPEPEQAASTFRRCAELASGAGAGALACQAKLGEAGALLLQKHRREAAAAYAQAADLAEAAGAVPLRIEALRMAGACHLLAGDRQETVRLWRTAVDAGLPLDAAARRSTTFAQVAHDLVELLQRLGMQVQAAEVRRRVEDENGAPAEPCSEDDDEAPAAATASAPHRNETQALPISMPRRVLPFVKGNVDPGWLDALVSAADAERRHASEPAAAPHDASTTQPIRVVPDLPRTLPFERAARAQESTTQAIQVVVAPGKVTPFAPGAVDPAVFHTALEDTLADTLDEGDAEPPE